MSRHIRKFAAIAEVDSAMSRHIEIVNLTRSHCLINNLSKDKFLYSMAIPMLYAAWEGYFKLSISVCLKRLCEVKRKAGGYPPSYITLHLQKEKFISTFYKQILQSIDLNVNQKPINNARFKALTELQTEMQSWLQRPVNASTNFDSLVMTYSNVNETVTKMNTDAIGIDTSSIDLRPLNELIGRRNDISHGGLLTFAEEVDAADMANVAEKVITEFHGAVKAWLVKN